MRKTGKTKKCLSCSSEFYVPRWEELNNRQYCSLKCYNKSKKGKIRNSVFVKCICGKEFLAQASQLKRGRDKYCSIECSKIGISESLKGTRQSQETKDKRAKANTGKKRSVEFRLSRTGEKCHLWKGGIWEKNKTEYQKYSRTSEWRHWRREVFERDNYTCQDCKDSTRKTLEPHHIIPMRTILKERTYNLIYDISNGVTLCRKCHVKTFKQIK